MSTPWHHGLERRAIVIANPVAGQRSPPDAARMAVERLAAGGWNVELVTTEHQGHAAEIAEAHRHELDMVVAVGGDGTVREVVAGIGDAGVAVGFVPLGNANVLARELRIPLDPVAAIRLLDEGEPSPVDIGRAGDALFLTMVGIGFDGWAVTGVDRLRATRTGGWVYRRGGSSLLYALAALPALLRILPTKVEIEVDGRPMRRRYPSLVISNSETYALGWAMSPGARMHDGQLDLHANRRTQPLLQLWTLVAAMRHRRLPAFIAEYSRGATYRLRAARPFRWQVDGDPMPPTRELTVAVEPAAARIIVPRGPRC